VLVDDHHLVVEDVVEVELIAAGRHGQGQVGGLLVGHAAEVDGHRPGRGLVVGNAAGGDAADEEVDLGAAQFAAVAFLDNDVDWVHLSPLNCGKVCRMPPLCHRRVSDA
jgi:hypothetical protein